ncbi:MAG: nucleotide exchange factor GrpE [Chloroflexi bacterium]|nr:nucleotide exchange factor GrpE [Chloroflexota bacterium]
MAKKKQEETTQQEEMQTTQDNPAAEDAAETQATEAQTAQEEPQDIAALQSELETTRAQMQEYLDGWQRERAAFANFRKRVEQQQEQTRRDITASIVKRYLEVLDDLELALKNRPTEGEGAAWAEGIELIYRKMLAILEAEGVKPIPAEPGMPFDPRFHEAITHEPHDEHGSEEIIEVVRQGYMIGDQVLRPALVRVAQ